MRTTAPGPKAEEPPYRVPAVAPGPAAPEVSLVKALALASALEDETTIAGLRWINPVAASRA